MAQNNPFDQFDEAAPRTVTIGTRDPAKVRAEERAQASAERSAEAASRQADAAGRAATTQERAAMNSAKEFVLKLSQDYNSDPTVKAYRTAIQQFGQALGTGTGPQADLALTYAFAKAMDPESVVRESEQGMVTSSQPWFQAAVERAKKQFAMDGAGNFTPEARDALRKQISNSVAQRAKLYDARRDYFEKQAGALGVDSSVVLGEHDAATFVPAIREWVDRVNGPAPEGQQAPNELDKAAAFTDTSPPDLPPANQGGNTPAGPAASGGGLQDLARPDINSMVQSMMAAGAGLATINSALKAKGATPIPMADFARAKAYMAANPGKAYPVNAQERRSLTMLEKLAASPLGSGLANYANAATAGTAAALAGERGEGALEAMQAMNPTASTIGSLAGGITGALGAEAMLGAKLAGTGLAKFAPRFADAAFGAATGFNGAEEGQGLQGAGLGALTGAIGGYAGEKALRGAGTVLKGASAPMSRKLREAGVPLTIGQVLGEGGALGRGVKKIEDALTSLPGIGNMVEARRMEGLQGFNNAAFDLAAETTGNQITDTGAAGVAQLKQAVGDAYSRALDPVTINTADDQLVADLGQAIASAQRIPNVESAQDAAMLGLQSRIDGAVDPLTETISGRGFQEAYRGLARTGRERANKDYGFEVGQVMRQGQDALAGALERQNPGAFEGFVNANAANRRANVLASAINPNAPQQLITPAQLQRADFNSTSKLENRINAAAGNGPFFDLAEAGQAVLPSTLPDSGTWTRALVGAGATGLLGGGGAIAGGGEGAVTGTGTGLGLTLALMAGGSKPAQRVAVAALLERPEALTRAGKLLADLAKFGGGVGAGATTPLLVGQ